MHVVGCGGGLFFTPVAVVLADVLRITGVGVSVVGSVRGWLISTLFKRLHVAGPASGVFLGYRSQAYMVGRSGVEG
jgi:hypothetical protein